jgi:hypothetical protein
MIRFALGFAAFLSVAPRPTVADDRVRPGETTVEPPTLISLGVD